MKEEEGDKLNNSSPYFLLFHSFQQTSGDSLRDSNSHISEVNDADVTYNTELLYELLVHLLPKFVHFAGQWTFDLVRKKTLFWEILNKDCK
jgi:hypothetical protein